MVKSLANIMEGNKQVKIYVGGSMTLNIFCFMLQDYA